MAKILLADDNSDVRFLIGRLLEEKFDVEIIDACSGQESSQLLLSLPIDLVVSDLHMPNGSGIWLYEFLCRQSLSVPFILFTSLSFDDLPAIGGNLKAIVPKKESPSLLRVIKNLNLFSERVDISRDEV